MVTFYKHHIPDWMNGTEELSDGAYRVYHVVCQLIYLNEGPISLNERGIAGRCRQRLDHFRLYVRELVAAGKISIVDGRIFNDRCGAEIKDVVANRERARKGGKRSGEARAAAPTQNPPIAYQEATSPLPNAYSFATDSSPSPTVCLPDSKPLNFHDPTEAPLQNLRSLKEKTREEKKGAAASVGTAVQFDARSPPDGGLAAAAEKMGEIERGAKESDDETRAQPSESQEKRSSDQKNADETLRSRNAEPLSRNDLDRIERLCREAAALENDPSPALLNLAPILGLLDGGSDLDLDVVPAIRSIARAGRKGRTWGYYVQPVIDFRKQRVRAANGVAEDHASAKETDEVRWRRMFEAWQRGTWPEGWGPDPESAGCQIPSGLIQQWSKLPGNAA